MAGSRVLLHRRRVKASGRLAAAIQLPPRKRLIFLPMRERSICAILGQRYPSYVTDSVLKDCSS